MILVSSYASRENEAGKTFFVLEVQGGIEMIKSTSTGKYYATARKTTIPCTFDEAMCKSLVGSKLPGKIVRQECEPYDYKTPESNEVIQLHHTYIYVGEGETMEENVFQELVN